MWNHYYLAATLSDALGYLNQHPDDSMVISGGTDLVLELKRGQHNDRTRIVDISRISGLDKIYTDNIGALHIGALVTHNQVTSSEMIRSTRAAWRKLLSRLALRKFAIEGRWLAILSPHHPRTTQFPP